MSIKASDVPTFEVGMRLRHAKSKREVIVIRVERSGVVVRNSRQLQFLAPNRFLTDKTVRGDYDLIPADDDRSGRYLWRPDDVSIE